MSQQQILLIIILSYFALLLGVAFYTARGSNNESFFVGNRSSKWWLVAFGMIGTSLSGMTFISVPGTVGAGAFGYFQVTIGYWLGYFIVAYVLLPVYYKMQLTSIYTYLDKRLGSNAHKTGSFFFILSRTLGATLRLYLVIKVLELFVLKDLGISFEVTSFVILGLILLYTFKGGVKTIVWTDTLQTTFMLLGLLISLFYISGQLGFSIPEAWNAVAKNGMTKIFATDPMPDNFFLKKILGGAFITIAMTGLDQEMMQKNISVSNLKDSQKNMVVMGTMQMIVVFIFLFLGGVLTMYASQHGIAAKGDSLFPAIALNSGLPFFITICFVIGLISALFPSADGALTALTSSFCIDILGLKMIKKGHKNTNEIVLDAAQEKKTTKTRLVVHISFAFIFLLCIFFFRMIDNGSLIDVLLKLAGFTYGPLLGLFAFGILTKRRVMQYAPFFLCLASMCLTFLVDLVNNYKYYKFALSDATLQSLEHLSKSIFGNYKIGVELLIINAAITFVLLLIFSRKAVKQNVDLDVREMVNVNS